MWCATNSDTQLVSYLYPVLGRYIKRMHFSEEHCEHIYPNVSDYFLVMNVFAFFKIIKEG